MGDTAPRAKGFEADVARVAKLLGRPPTHREYEVIGMFEREAVAAEFGDGEWLKALDELGHDITEMPVRPITEEMVREDIRRVAEDLGHAPVEPEYVERGAVSVPIVKDRLGVNTWNNALRTAELTPHDSSTPQISNDELEADLAKVAEECEGPLNKSDYARLGEYSVSTIANRIGGGSWRDAVESLGYQSGRARISDDELREDVAHVIRNLGEPLTVKQYSEHGVFTPETVANRFGNGKWTEALDELGHHHPNVEIPDDDLKSDIARVVDEVGEPLKLHEYKARGEYAYSTVADRFGGGTWTDALDELGYEVSGGKIPDQDLRDDVARVVDEVGDPLTAKEYREHGEYSVDTVANRFGDKWWAAALDELGHHAGNEIPEERLREDVNRVVDNLGRAPKSTEYQKWGEHADETIVRRFADDGGWWSAMNALGYDKPEGAEDREYPNRIPESALRNDVERVAEELGKPPTSTEYDRHGKHSYTTITRRFGDDDSWRAALSELGYDIPKREPHDNPSRDDVREDFEFVVDKLGHVPSPTEYKEHGAHGLYHLRKHFLGDNELNRWTNILDRLGYES